MTLNCYAQSEKKRAHAPRRQAQKVRRKPEICFCLSSSPDKQNNNSLCTLRLCGEVSESLSAKIGVNLRLIALTFLLPTAHCFLSFSPFWLIAIYWLHSSELVKAGSVFPQYLLPCLRRDAPEALMDCLLSARPGGSRQGEISGPENVFCAHMLHEGCDLVEPGGEAALAVEHLRRLKLVALGGKAVMLELMVGPLQVDHAPAQRALRKYNSQTWVP